jgi:hypothetical protein
MYFKPTLISVAEEMIRTGFVGLSAEVSNTSFLPSEILTVLQGAWNFKFSY